MEPIPSSLTLRTLHAELRELAVAMAAEGGLRSMPGSIVRKRIRGGVFTYYQYRDLAGSTRQLYLGPEREARVEELLQRLDSGPDPEDRARLEEVHAAYVAAGAPVLDHAPMRVLRGFADAGVLRPGLGSAVLVGTHAFAAHAHLLGVRWPTAAGTQDIDVAAPRRGRLGAGAENDVDLAIGRPQASAPDVLERLGMGFLPVPSLDPRGPSTSYKVRGQPVRVDLLTPATGDEPGPPVEVPAFRSMAQALPLLDYLIEDTVAGLVVGRRDLLLVTLPAPERFALHKLLVARMRPAVFATKSAKDRMQARLVLTVLRQEAPLGIRSALRALRRRGGAGAKRLPASIESLRSEDPEIAAWLQAESEAAG